MSKTILNFKAFFFSAFILIWAFQVKADFIDHFANKNDIGANKVPRLGDPKIMVVPVFLKNGTFSANKDVNFLGKDYKKGDRVNLDADAVAIKNWKENLEKVFNGKSGGKFIGFKEYYKRNSGNLYRPEPVIIDPVSLDCPVKLKATRDIPAQSISKGDCVLQRGDLETYFGVSSVIKEVLAEINKRHSEKKLNIKDFDKCGDGKSQNFDYKTYSCKSGDGFVDGIVFVFAARYYGIAFPYGYKDSAGLGVFFDDPYDIDGVKVTNMAIASDMSSEKAAYLALHEFAHLLGAADLYNEGNSSKGSAKAADFCKAAETETKAKKKFGELADPIFSQSIPLSLMGGYDYSDKFPMMIGFTRYQMGWARPMAVVGENVKVKIHPAASAKRSILILANQLSAKAGSLRPEYFILENRQPDVFDRELSKENENNSEGGVLVTRVNLNRLPKSDNGKFIEHLFNCLNCDPFDSLITVMERDSQFEMLDCNKNSQKGVNTFEPEEDLMRANDVFETDADNPKFTRTSQKFVANEIDGTPSGYRVRIDSFNDDKSYTVSITNTNADQKDPCQLVSCGFRQVCEKRANGNGFIGQCVLDETLEDEDKDGVPKSGGDCDDKKVSVNWANKEKPYDGIDNDCNPYTLDDDLDRDGLTVAQGDCNDKSSKVGKGVCKPSSAKGSGGTSDFNDGDGSADDNKALGKTEPSGNQSGCSLVLENEKSAFNAYYAFLTFLMISALLLYRKKTLDSRKMLLQRIKKK